MYRFGKQERIFRMEYISNSAFTDQEFSKWKTEVLIKSCVNWYLRLIGIFRMRLTQ